MDRPVTTFKDLAVFHHEIFISYTAAGFTEPQALLLVIVWIQKPEQENTR